MTALALYGSGEFTPWARAVDTWCVEHATTPGDRVLVLPTASAPEGDHVFARWIERGLEHYTALGLHPESIALRTRADAFDLDLASRVPGARLIFFSGGNPGYLAETLVGTPFWQSVVDAVHDGTALAGCSAGAVFLGTRAPFVADDELQRWVPGTGLLSRAFLLAHFDQLDAYEPGLRTLWARSAPEDTTVVGIDEDTAMCGDGVSWTTHGRGSSWITTAGEVSFTGFAHEESFRSDLGLDLSGEQPGLSMEQPVG